MKTINPSSLSSSELHGYLLGAVAPRPIAFASTVDKEGKVNLSPFSFFNVFSSNPPVMVFSPARRGRDNTTKHTLQNIEEVPEVVINIVSHNIVEQMSLSSTEYDKGVNEFNKAGLTEVASEEIKPPRVGESPAAFECKVNEIIPLGKEGGAGNLIICEVLLIQINEKILDKNGKIDPYKLDAVGRMGGNWYCRAQGEALFEVAKPLRNKGIGVDAIPEDIRLSEVLTGNHLGKLGNIAQLPNSAEIDKFSADKTIQEFKKRFSQDTSSFKYHLHELARDFLDEGKVDEAWKVLLQEF